jgi:hypothetical protein
MVKISDEIISEYVNGFLWLQPTVILASFLTYKYVRSNLLTLKHQGYVEYYIKLLIISLVVPVYEEYAFRVYVRDVLIHYEIPFASIITATMFGLLHTTNYLFNYSLRRMVIQVCSTFLAGLVFQSRDLLIVSVMLHGTYNALSTIILTIMSHYVVVDQPWYEPNSVQIHKRRHSYPDEIPSVKSVLNMSIFNHNVSSNPKVVELHNDMTRQINKINQLHKGSLFGALSGFD